MKETHKDAYFVKFTIGSPSIIRVPVEKETRNIIYLNRDENAAEVIYGSWFSYGWDISKQDDQEIYRDLESAVSALIEKSKSKILFQETILNRAKNTYRTIRRWASITV